MSVKHALAMAKNRAFADHIAQQLAERGWSLKRLATEAGATYTTAFRNAMTGRSTAAPKTLERVAPVLGVSAGELATLYGPEARRRAKKRAREQAATLMPTVDMVNARWGTGAPSPKVTAKNGQVTFPKFALTLADDGTVRVTLDLVNLSIEQASQLLAWLHENGLLSKERA